MSAISLHRRQPFDLSTPSTSRCVILRFCTQFSSPTNRHSCFSRVTPSLNLEFRNPPGENDDIMVFKSGKAGARCSERCICRSQIGHYEIAFAIVVAVFEDAIRVVNVTLAPTIIAPS